MGAREHRDSGLEQPSGLVGALPWRLSQLRWAGPLHLGTGGKARQRQPDSRGGGECRGRQAAKAHGMEHILSLRENHCLGFGQVCREEGSEAPGPVVVDPS